jgi:hypothetical protein
MMKYINTIEDLMSYDRKIKLKISKHNESQYLNKAKLSTLKNSLENPNIEENIKIYILKELEIRDILTKLKPYYNIKIN